MGLRHCKPISDLFKISDTGLSQTYNPYPVLSQDSSGLRIFYYLLLNIALDRTFNLATLEFLMIALSPYSAPPHWSHIQFGCFSPQLASSPMRQLFRISFRSSEIAHLSPASAWKLCKPNLRRLAKIGYGYTRSANLQ